MMIQGKCRVLLGCLLIFLLVVFLSGCGGVGSGTSSNDGSPTGALVDINALPGPIVAVRVGELAVLDGSRSSSSTHGSLSYEWTFTSKPDASNTELQNLATAKPSFVADARGIYMVQLVVSAGGISSQRVIAIVVATHENERPTGPVNHAGLSSHCANCHDGGTLKGNGDTLIAKSPDHLASSNVCQACHTPENFALIPFVDHIEVFGNCSVCHNGVIAIGKSNRHVPTNAECDDCHNTTNFLELELDGSFDHTDINRDCAVCHNGIVATGKHDDHIPTEGDCSLCHITDNFQTVNFDHSNIDKPCSECHDGAVATGKTLDHIETSAECGMCHNTLAFTPAFVDHTSTEVTSKLCGDCHNNVDAVGLTLNHMPIADGQDCDACHTPGTFATGVFDHAGVVGNCASCHDGVISTGLSENHLPTTKDCGACHSSTETFTEAVFDHADIVGNCVSCHDGVISIGKHVVHIPTVEDCGTCHDTDNFKGATFDHTDVTRGCEGCHNGRFTTAENKILGKSVDHVPTNQDCYFCHTTDAFKPTSFTHEGISGNCASCHDGNNDGAGAIGLSANHIPTTADCGACHSAPVVGNETVTFATAFVDHTSPEVINARCDSCHNGTAATGKNIDHVETTQDCGVCHSSGGTFVPAVFDHSNIPANTRCDSCHGVTATGKHTTHISTNEDCSVCHNTTAFAGAKFDHTGIVDNCAACHDGNTAIGKTPNHVPTNSDCGQCHLTTGFIPATFDHVGIVDNCQSCHDGVLATGKTPNHPATNEDCGVCHTTRTFAGAVFDHTGIVDNCSSCHGVSATGKSVNHVPTDLDCHFCHTTATFVGGTFDHQGINGNCQSCHDGTTATGKSQNHFITTQDCNTCHSTRGWAPIDFMHSANSDYPGDHNRNVGCIDCHTDNNETISYPFPQYAPFCAACHANDFRREGDHIGGNNGTVEQNKNCGASGCHRVSARNWD